MTDTQTETTLAIVCADVSGSTALYESEGNIRARAQINSCLNLLQTSIAAHNGTFIHSRGDDVLCTFTTATDAYHAVKDMLEQTADNDLSVHIGIDHGRAIRTDDDVFGDAVNMAARLANLATPNEALVSNAFFSNLSDDHKSALKFFDKRHIKGKSAPERIYRLTDFNQATTTLMSFAKTDHRGITGGTPLAHISFLDHTAICGVGKSVTIGRAPECDLTIPRKWISRQHIVIEMRKDHAYLRDISSNGTYVCFVGQPPVLLRRETMALPTICTLSPTREPDATDAVAITCHITTQALSEHAP